MEPTTVTEWYNRWRKPVRSWLQKRLGVVHMELDDLAQEVFIRLLRYDSKDAVDNPAGYLFRIASNVASEHRCKAGVHAPHDSEWLEGLTAETRWQPEKVFEFQQDIDAVREVFSKLSPRQQNILLLHVNQGLTYKQIAVHLGLNKRIVLRDLTRAYSRLRIRLGSSLDRFVV